MSTGSSDSVLVVIRFIVASMPEASKKRAHSKEAIGALIGLYLVGFGSF